MVDLVSGGRSSIQAECCFKSSSAEACDLKLLFVPTPECLVLMSIALSRAIKPEKLARLAFRGLVLPLIYPLYRTKRGQ